MDVTNEEQNIEIANEVEEVKKKIILHITGEVIKPGIVELEEGSRIIDAIEAAGGTTAKANVSKINLAYLVEDGMKIYVPNINDKEEVEYVTKSSGKAIVETSKEDSSKEVKVNLNTATTDELEKLPGIGTSIANRIIMYRNENGNFKTIEDIKNVSGIGDAKFNNIKSYIYVK